MSDKVLTVSVVLVALLVAVLGGYYYWSETANSDSDTNATNTNTANQPSELPAVDSQLTLEMASTCGPVDNQTLSMELSIPGQEVTLRTPYLDETNLAAFADRNDLVLQMYDCKLNTTDCNTDNQNLVKVVFTSEAEGHAEVSFVDGDSRVYPFRLDQRDNEITCG